MLHSPKQKTHRIHGNDICTCISIYVDFHGECNVGKYTIHGILWEQQEPKHQFSGAKVVSFMGSARHETTFVVKKKQHDVSLSSLFVIGFSFNLLFFHSRVIKGH